ncbi:hypothetical protein [Streptomyces cadmiisoli]|uniref:hypothetical protein n=1 Tax=Streptomyces cadmiisoli TaxID=2184053 RepID=UPI0036644F7C
MTTDPPHPTATVLVALWPTDGDTLANPDVNADEWRHFAKHYADVPLIELWRRLRTAEWNAAYYRGEYKATVEHHKAYPPLYRIQEMDARHRRVRDLLAVPRRRSIPRAELEAALNGPLPDAHAVNGERS